MRLSDFIIENREIIDREILRKCPNVGRLNDRERRLWVLNDFELYSWAQCEGVQM
jgi:hypothetical protein